MGWLTSGGWKGRKTVLMVVSGSWVVGVFDLDRGLVIELVGVVETTLREGRIQKFWLLIHQGGSTAAAWVELFGGASLNTFADGFDLGRGSRDRPPPPITLPYTQV